MEITHKQLDSLIEVYINMSPRRSLMVWGAVGIGKSENIRNKFIRRAKKLNLEFVDWVKCSSKEKENICKNVDKYLVFVDERIALKDSTDNRGIPLLNGNGLTVGEGENAINIQYLQWVKTLVMNVASLPKSNVVFFKDEINLAPPSVQSTEYQMILDRALDELAFATNTFIIAAGNRQEDRTGVNEMSMALKNRFGHCTLLPPDTDSWAKWAIENKKDSRIVSYVSLFKGNKALYDFPSADSDTNAYPTPRTVAFCCDAIKDIKGTTPEDYKHIEMIVSSWLGDAWAIDFKSWLKLTEKVDIDDVLHNPEKIKAFGIDLQTSILSAICQRYVEKKEVLNDAINVAFELREEISVYMLKMLSKIHELHFTTEIAKNEKYYMKITERFEKYLVNWE